MKRFGKALGLSLVLATLAGTAQAHTVTSTLGPVHLGTSRNCARITSSIGEGTNPIGQVGLYARGTVTAYWWTGSACGSQSAVPQMSATLWYTRKAGNYFIDCQPASATDTATNMSHLPVQADKVLVKGDVCTDGYQVKAGDLIATRIRWSMTTNDQPPVTFPDNNLYSPTHAMP